MLVARWRVFSILTWLYPDSFFLVHRCIYVTTYLTCTLKRNISMNINNSKTVTLTQMQGLLFLSLHRENVTPVALFSRVYNQLCPSNLLLFLVALFFPTNFCWIHLVYNNFFLVRLSTTSYQHFGESLCSSFTGSTSGYSLGMKTFLCTMRRWKALGRYQLILLVMRER